MGTVSCSPQNKQEQLFIDTDQQRQQQLQQEIMLATKVQGFTFTTLLLPTSQSSEPALSQAVFQDQ